VYVKIDEIEMKSSGPAKVARATISGGSPTRARSMQAPAERPAAAPRRQARGERRIAQLLDAAGEVFATVGYDAATTNAIAAQAGVSPGTLYQFFPNKQAMAEALATEYAARYKVASDRALDPAGTTDLTFEALVDRLTDPLLAFHREAPAFEALFTGSVVSPDLAERIQQFHTELCSQLERIFAARRPDLAQAVIHSHAQVAIQIFKGLLPLAKTGGPEQRKQGARELKTVIERYLRPVLGDTGLGDAPPLGKRRATKGAK
jgi:AcrR family transcriptional regulator